MNMSIDPGISMNVSLDRGTSGSRTRMQARALVLTTQFPWQSVQRMTVNDRLVLVHILNSAGQA